MANRAVFVVCDYENELTGWRKFLIRPWDVEKQVEHLLKSAPMVAEREIFLSTWQGGRISFSSANPNSFIEGRSYRD
jgi:hypothetical protein